MIKAIKTTFFTIKKQIESKQKQIAFKKLNKIKDIKINKEKITSKNFLKNIIGQINYKHLIYLFLM